MFIFELGSCPWQATCSNDTFFFLKLQSPGSHNFKDETLAPIVFCADQLGCWVGVLNSTYCGFAEKQFCLKSDSISNKFMHVYNMNLYV